MAAVGPVCHIPPKTTSFVLTPKAIQGLPPPAQPTIASLQSTVNQLRQYINQMNQNFTEIINNINNQAPGQISSNAKGGGTFTQASQQLQTVRVFQGNDPTSPNYVDVQYVTKLVMDSDEPQGSWTYNAPPPTPPSS